MFGFARNHFSANPKENNIYQFQSVQFSLLTLDIHEKQKHGKHLAEGAAQCSAARKETAREESHGAHKETDAEKAGGSVAEPSESVAENFE
jgi:hypothetical protein